MRSASYSLKNEFISAAIEGLADWISEGNRVDAKFRSFESFRSNLKAPEVLTFDELVERARWNVELAERQEEAEAEVSDFEL